MDRSYQSTKRMDSNNKALDNWLFHYNSYNETWYGFVREDHSDYFNGNCFTVKSKNISVLMELITRANGDKNKIKEVIY